MKKKPAMILKPSVTMKLIGSIFLIFPVLYPLFIFLMLNIPFENITLFVFDPKFYALSSLSLLTGYGFFKVKKYCYNIFLTTLTLISLLNYYMIFSFAESNYKPLLFLASLVILVSFAVFVSKEVRAPHLFPKILWWENDPRLRLSINVNIQKNNEKLKGEILDISKTGSFIKTNDKFSLGETINLEFTFFNHTMYTPGEIVLLSERGVTRPRGIGVKFLSDDKTFKNELKKSLAEYKISRKQTLKQRK